MLRILSRNWEANSGRFVAPSWMIWVLEGAVLPQLGCLLHLANIAAAALPRLVKERATPRQQKNLRRMGEENQAADPSRRDAIHIHRDTANGVLPMPTATTW